MKHIGRLNYLLTVDLLIILFSLQNAQVDIRKSHAHLPLTYRRSFIRSANSAMNVSSSPF